MSNSGSRSNFGLRSNFGSKSNLGQGQILGQKISDEPFLVVHQNFSNSSPNFLVIYLQIFHFFASVVKFHENSLLGCPPVLHHAQVTTFFSSSVVIYLHFFTKTYPSDASQGGCLGPSHHPHPPLHATARDFSFVDAVEIYSLRLP